MKKLIEIVIAVLIGFRAAQIFWLSDYGKRIHEIIVKEIISQERRS